MQVYTEACRPVVEAAVDGFNGTVFAYGVTSSGKTHTITVRQDETKPPHSAMANAHHLKSSGAGYPARPRLCATDAGGRLPTYHSSAGAGVPAGAVHHGDIQRGAGPSASLQHRAGSNSTKVQWGNPATCGVWGTTHLFATGNASRHLSLVNPVQQNSSTRSS